MKLKITLTIIALLFLVSAILLTTGIARAQDTTPPPTDVTDLTAVLTWLIGFGAPYLVGQIISWLAENWEKWHALPKFAKFLIPLFASVAISIGATFLLKNTAFVKTIGPIWAMLSEAVIAYWSTQKAYIEARQANYGLRKT